MKIRIRYNSPVVLTFALISLGALLLGLLTSGKSTVMFFSVYRSSLRDVLTYPRFFLHVLGHSSWDHFFSNILLMLVIGPPLEEKYGGKRLLKAMAVTALLSGLVQFFLFPDTMLLGASGIVFMMLVLLSMTDMKDGDIPVTMLLVLAFYVGREIINGVTVKDNISQLTHVIGGVIGAAAGFVMNKSGNRKKSKK